MRDITIEHHGNTTIIQRPEGEYTIHYGMHIKRQDPRELPHDVSAVMLETGTAKYLDDPLKTVSSLKAHTQYKDLISHLEKKKIPLIFADVKYKYNDYMLLLADNGLAALEWMHGMKLLKKEEGRTLPDISRLLLGGWLLFPSLVNVARLASAFTGIGIRQTGELKKLSHVLHPEVDFLYLTLRNAIIAEKQRVLMDMIGHKRRLATVLGAGHVGIEDMLSMHDALRLQNIKSLLPIIRQFVMPEYFYKAVQYVYNGSHWEVNQVIEVPSLKALL